MRPRRPSPAMIVALLALFMALGGTSLAASRYLISRTSQIKPSVLRAIAAQARITSSRQISPSVLHKLVVPGSNVVARARSTAPVATTTGTPGAAVPMSGTTWTQSSEELDQFIGQYSVSVPSTEQCGGPSTTKTGHWITLAVQFVAGEYALESTIETGSEPRTATQNFDLTPFFEPGKPVSHTLSVVAWDDCATGVHATIESVSVDVIGIG